MRIFVTGATGFIGSAIVQELIQANHQVLGLARSETAAQALIAAGAQVHRGDLNDLESLRKGAAASDGVIHTAFNHDFSKWVANCEADRHIIEALGSPLAGSERLLLVSSGTAMAHTPGRTSIEEDAPNSPHPRIASEQAAAAATAQGVRASVIRLPQVHDPLKQGLITYLLDIAQSKKVSAYVGDGLNRWPAVHRLDAARLYALAFEKNLAGVRYHAVAEEGIAFRDIAEAIGQKLNLPVVAKKPEEAEAHFGWLATLVGLDMPASSTWTQAQLGWHPSGPNLLSDLESANYAI